MEKIQFKNNDAPYLSAENLNQLQTNIETAIGKINKKNTYSTEEQVIGTWMGKPLYRRVFTISNVGTATTITLSNIDNVMIFGGHLCKGTSVFPLNMSLGGYGYTACYFEKSTSYLHINSSYEIESGYIILEYTKTTD